MKSKEKSKKQRLESQIANTSKPTSGKIMLNFSSTKILPSTEQINLVRIWQQSADNIALNRLISSNIRAVIKEARKFKSKNPSISYDDLLQEGLAGMVKAANMFDEKKNVTFLCYALWWVRANMRRYIMDYKSVVRIGTTRNDRVLFSNLSKVMSKFDHVESESEKIELTARALKTSANEVRTMLQNLKSGDMRLDAPVSGDESESLAIDNLKDESFNEEDIFDSFQNEIIADAVKEIMESMPEDEKKVIINRFMTNDPRSLRDLADEMKISREWVRKIEIRALDRLKKRLISQYNYRGM
jgi:RNA polymerase sigma-32 factor